MFFTEEEATRYCSHEDLTLNASPDDGGHNDESSNDDNEEEERTSIGEQEK